MCMANKFYTDIYSPMNDHMVWNVVPSKLLIGYVVSQMFSVDCQSVTFPKFYVCSGPYVIFNSMTFKESI